MIFFWLIPRWEKKKCCYKLSKCTKWHLFHSKWSKLSFWVKIVVILSVAQLVATFIFFSAWDKSCVKGDDSRNSTLKMRTIVGLDLDKSEKNLALIYLSTIQALAYETKLIVDHLTRCVLRFLESIGLIKDLWLQMDGIATKCPFSKRTLGRMTLAFQK